jgi:MOSC domain-containing protein YiiM
MENSILPQLISIQVGKICEFSHREKTWSTAFHKHPVTGSQWVSKLGVQGDQQADLKNHGGADKALLGYATEHYAQWQTEYPEVFHATNMPWGSFGENLAIQGCNEQNVCLGDIWQIGEVVLEVSQPRQPCWKLARRWDMVNLPAAVLNNNRSGWYFRVLQEGWLTAGDVCQRISQPHSNWNIANVSNTLHKHKQDITLAAELAALPALAESWRNEFQQRVAKLKIW